MDVKVNERFAGVIALAELKKHAEGDGPLKDMILFRNSRQALCGPVGACPIKP